MNDLNNNYFRDLVNRQNRNVTTAQIHLFFNAKRYKNKDLKECSELIDQNDKENNNQIIENNKINNEKFIQKDLEGEEVKFIDDKNNENLLEVDKLKKINYLKSEEEFLNEYFVYGNRLILLDENRNMILKYKLDLFDELIDEFSKLYKWLDESSSSLKYVDSYKDMVTIDKEEVETTIKFLIKLNKIPNEKTESSK